MNHDQILKANRQVYNAMAADKAPLCRPAKDSELADPLATIDPAGWLGTSIAGANVLCLAAGGGRQSSLYAAAGANVTVVDLSSAMLELDRQVASERGFPLRLFETSMEDLSALRDGEFDLVIHPVSTCYIPDVRPVFEEVARVLRGDGLYISQHKQPTSLQASIDRDSQGYRLQHKYYHSSPVPPPATTSKSAQRLRERGAVEFLHRWEQLVGLMCRAGFLIEDLVEPMHAQKDAAVGSFADRAAYVAPYVRIKARRKANASQRDGNQKSTGDGSNQLWLPS